MNRVEESQSREGLLNEEMQATVRAIELDFERQRAVVRLLPGTCCDMTGCIAVIRRLYPAVQEVRTFSGGRPDTAYRLIGGEWRAFRAPRPVPPLQVQLSC